MEQQRFSAVHDSLSIANCSTYGNRVDVRGDDGCPHGQELLFVENFLASSRPAVHLPALWCKAGLKPRGVLNPVTLRFPAGMAAWRC